jgi:hypothetical protein
LTRHSPLQRPRPQSASERQCSKADSDALPVKGAFWMGLSGFHSRSDVMYFAFCIFWHKSENSLPELKQSKAFYDDATSMYSPDTRTAL